jgi:hypothetical protein
MGKWICRTKTEYKKKRGKYQNEIIKGMEFLGYLPALENII